MRSLPPAELMSLTLERALRWAAVWHRDQERRGSGVPYVQHAMAVAMILDRLGFPEEVVIAGLLHDVVEDTEATLDQVRSAFGAEVAEIVRHCSEVKLDAQGRKRPWIDRKRDHLDALATAPLSALAVVLADKLHNLRSIQLDLQEGRPVWSQFHADREQVLWYYRSAIEQLGGNDPRLEALTRQCRQVLNEVEALGA
jgi:guanosine-3',5'-bis(diphosphate) 3'-pyrophosphohydrolase